MFTAKLSINYDFRVKLKINIFHLLRRWKMGKCFSLFSNRLLIWLNQRQEKITFLTRRL